jgi:hypothetical protein
MAMKNLDNLGSIQGLASVVIAENLLVYMKTDKQLALANAAVGTAKAARGFAAAKTYAVGERATAFRQGKVISLVDDADAALTVGTTYYLSDTTAGRITKVKPSDVGDLVQEVGFAMSTTELQISIGPSNVVASSGTWLQ